MVELRFSALPIQGQITGRFLETGNGYPETGHKGVDIGAPVGTQVIHATDIETVVYAMHAVRPDGLPADGWGDGSLGNCLVLDYKGTPWYGFFAHLKSFGQGLAVNKTITKGTVLGEVGLTGKTSGPHLHWALCRNTGHNGTADQFADPLEYLHPEVANDQRLARLEASLQRLERLIGGYGLLGPDGATLRGDAALQYADERQFSALLAGQEARQRVGELAVTVMQLAANPTDLSLREDMISGLGELLARLEAK